LLADIANRALSCSARPAQAGTAALFENLIYDMSHVPARLRKLVGGDPVGKELDKPLALRHL